MRHLKQKLMAATAMVMVAFVMLTSASYAWFTISTTPEVDTIVTSVQTNENFEIALGTVEGEKPAETTTDDFEDYTTWGQLVDLADVDFTGLGPATVEEKSDADDTMVLKSTEYGEDGRPNGLVEIEDADVTDGVAVLQDADTNDVVQKVLLWVRSNKAGTVTVDISDVTFKTAATPAVDLDEDDGNKVQVAFDFGADGDVVVTNIAEGACEDVEIGEIGTDDYPVNTAIPMYMYIYLEGNNVTNADVAVEAVASIGSIIFENSGITEANAYTNN